MTSTAWALAANAIVMIVLPTAALIWLVVRLEHDRREMKRDFEREFGSGPGADVLPPRTRRCCPDRSEGV